MTRKETPTLAQARACFRYVVGTATFWSVIDGVIFTLALRAADHSYQHLDGLIQDDLPRPSDPVQVGSAASFMNQKQGLDAAGPEWGPFRIAFLQYASDPVTFFDPQSVYSQPAWTGSVEARLAPGRALTWARVPLPGVAPSGPQPVQAGTRRKSSQTLL